MTEGYRARTYRKAISPGDLVSFTIREKESDLFIIAEKMLQQEALASLQDGRRLIELYLREKTGFADSLEPLPLDKTAPPLIMNMLEAAQQAGVGPMAAVAGAVAEYVGKELRKYSRQVMVENGGDIFLDGLSPVTVRIFTDNPLFKDRIKIRIPLDLMPAGVCTSSGVIGPSLSYGHADTVTVLSPSTALADAAATCLGNLVKSEEDIEPVLGKGAQIDGVVGILVIIGEKLGAWGTIELV